MLADRIDLNTLIKEIPYKRRAISYIGLASGLFGMSKDLHPPKTITSRIFLLHYHLNLSSNIYYHSFRIIRGFVELVFVDYLGKIPGIIFNREIRKTVFRKLCSKKWYKQHISSFRKRFR
jgi:hypothetical protein